MSRRKTFLSGQFLMPFDFEALTQEDKQDIEKSIDFMTSDRLSAIMENSGQDKFVQICGRSWKQVSRYLRGDKPPTDVLKAISDETGVSIDWLAQGKLLTSRDHRYAEGMLRSAGNKAVVRLKTIKPEPAWSKLGYTLKVVDDRLDDLDTFVPAPHEPSSAPIETGEPNHFGMVTIPRYDEVRPSAGPGSVAVSETPTTRVAFERHWLTQIGVQADSAVILPAQGDSMEPTIMNGSPMLVDTTKTEVRSGFIYVFNIDGDLVVKRVERRPDQSYDLISDNRRYASWNLTREKVSHMTVIGRVYAAVSKF